MTDTRDVVLQAARQLFGERGYGAVTIREIAIAAGVSPAMVMKVGGSKEQLHADATPLEPEPLPRDIPLEGLGEVLVRRMLNRREEDGAEPWLRALYLIADAPDRASARSDFRERFLSRFEHLADRADDPVHDLVRRQADQLACLMVGLAAGTRSIRLLDPDGTDLEVVVSEYGALVQQVLDRMVAGSAQDV
ncbi:TetR/AcrR family transcriptional regulator [Ornithinimicrobium cryptoxanthini]|uniref:TetR family transcriptional regulator n=1 Tax=Ornithinimicrobium cryptoxanthini TaxID=2934161 RepID=A0ABY4YDU9_9MICO|nr:TetR/AcrR family transcriptional regulator [Ornithinimicrobium cryptoxanthini]USQ74819.1 TetR family transcriptional regulator [Ornithinimicrobium cryptoxanthini]